MARKGHVERIDLKMFAQAIAAIKQAQQSLQSAKTIMRNSTQTLLGSWEGYGKDAFEKVYKTLSTNLNDEGDNLDAIRQQLETIENTYRDWDSKTASGMEKGG
jgi:WXG100 family type VII secretion target